MPDSRSILLVVTKSNFGGAQRYVRDLAAAIAARGDRVAVALGGTGRRGAASGMLASELESRGIPTHPIRSFMRDVALVDDIRAIVELVALMRRIRPDVVHLNSSKAGGIGALAARITRARRIVFTLHGAPWDEQRPAWQRVLIRIASWATMLLCHRVIAITTRDYAAIRRWPYIASKAMYVPNRIPAEPLLSREDARKKISVGADDALIIGCIGEHVRNKGVDVLIKALGILPAGGPAWRCMLVGEGEDRGVLERSALELGIADRVTFTGYVAGAGGLISAFDLLVIPSRKEGLPYVLLEAAGARRAVIATAVGGIPDLVTDGETGLLVPPEDPQALAHAIYRLGTDRELREKLGDGLGSKAASPTAFKEMCDGLYAAYAP